MKRVNTWKSKIINKLTSEEKINELGFENKYYDIEKAINILKKGDKENLTLEEYKNIFKEYEQLVKTYNKNSELVTLKLDNEKKLKKKEVKEQKDFFKGNFKLLKKLYFKILIKALYSEELKLQLGYTNKFYDIEETVNILKKINQKGLPFEVYEEISSNYNTAIIPFIKKILEYYKKRKERAKRRTYKNKSKRIYK